MVWTLANLFWLFSVGLVVLFLPPSGQSIHSFSWCCILLEFPAFSFQPNHRISNHSWTAATSSVHRDELIQTPRFSTYHGAMKYKWLLWRIYKRFDVWFAPTLTADFHGSPSKTTTPKTCCQRTRRNDPSSLRARKGRKSPESQSRLAWLGRRRCRPTDGLELHVVLLVLVLSYKSKDASWNHEGPWNRKGFHVLFVEW